MQHVSFCWRLQVWCHGNWGTILLYVHTRYHRAVASSWGTVLHHIAAPTVHYSLHKVRPNKQLVCHDHCWSILAMIYTVPQDREVGCPWSPKQQYRLAWQWHWESLAGFPWVGHPGRSSLQAEDHRSGMWAHRGCVVNQIATTVMYIAKLLSTIPEYEMSPH